MYVSLQTLFFGPAARLEQRCQASLVGVRRAETGEPARIVNIGQAKLAFSGTGQTKMSKLQENTQISRVVG